MKSVTVLWDRLRRHAWLLLLAFLCGNAWATLADTPPMWFAGGRPTTEAKQAIQLLLSAGDDGLDADDYKAATLAQALEEADRGAPLTDARQAMLSVVLTGAMERFLSDLHSGRVRPRDIDASFAIPEKSLDPALFLRQAVASHALVAAVMAARPQIPIYGSLQQALAQYRQLNGNPASHTPLPPLPSKKLEPGQDYAGAGELAQRLILLGDLAPSGVQAGTHYGAYLVEGVKAFQVRHGLAADGIIGKSTFAQLNIPIATRIRQIELTLERLRWTPLLLGDRMIVVNVPEFVLHAYETRSGGSRLSMSIIVGKALDKRTPLFFEEMRYIEFSPYWNIPPSIARSETVPKLLRSPAYFAEQGLEFVKNDGTVIGILSKENLDAVMRGQMRIRQRPGPKNALGDIKFVFPNNNNIYLHHTPAVELFKRDRRDLSHGCVRVDDPVALAQFVLQNQPGWSEERIRAAMGSGNSSTLRLAHPIPVVIAYGTAVVKGNGKVYFFEDIYGNDELLDRVLRKREKSIREGTDLQLIPVGPNARP